MKRRGRRLVFTLLLIAVTIGIDQCAKGVARAVLPPAQPIALLPGVVLCLTRNPGAFLSFGSSLSGGVRFWALTVGVSVGLVALFAWLLASRSLTAAPSAGMALILGGGFSNLFDRLAHGGVVTDFLVLGIGRLRTGVFNLADLAISAGTVVLLIAARRGPRRSDERPVEGAGTPRIGPMSGPTSRPSRRSGA